MSGTDVLQLIAGGVTMGAIYALVAMGFHIIYNSTGAINFAQGEQVVLGGVLALSLTTLFRLPLPVAFFLTLALGGAIGLAYERVAIRPLLKATELAIIISSIGVAITFANGMALIWGKEPLPFPAFSGESPVKVAGVNILPQSFWIVGLTIIFLVLLYLFFGYTLMGKAIQAAANNSTGARLVGISPGKVVAYSFAISGGLSAVAGVIVSPLTFAGGALGTAVALKGFSGAILGGISSAGGVVLGGLLLGVLEFLIAGFISSGYRDAIAFTILLIMLVARPQGLFVREGK